jgi:hypothetical protein
MERLDVQPRPQKPQGASYLPAGLMRLRSSLARFFSKGIAHMATVYSSARLRWKGDALSLDGKGRAVARVVPDQTYAGMWRVELSGGRLSDMANKSRAKDAAISLALQSLNVREAA